MVIPLKDKKGMTITNAFQKLLNESNRKPNKIWVGKGSEFNNRSMKSWFEKNGIKMYSTHNEVKSVVAERFIRTIKYINTWLQFQQIFSLQKLDDIVDKYNNAYHSTIKVKSVDVNQIHIKIVSSKEINDNNPKFKNGDNVRISKHKNVW